MGYHDQAMAQIRSYRKRLWNEEKRALAHIWDDEKQQLKDAALWGGGNGWAAAGVARVLRLLPREREKDREELSVFLWEIVSGCLSYQRADGLFHNVLDQPTTFVETNAAQMLAYAIYVGVKGGWLAKRYRGEADRMREAARKKMDAHGFVQDVCGAPEFDRPGISTEGQAFSIMMEAAGAAS